MTLKLSFLKEFEKRIMSEFDSTGDEKIEEILREDPNDVECREAMVKQLETLKQSLEIIY
jgi:hypothetical protein